MYARPDDIKFSCLILTLIFPLNYSFMCKASKNVVLYIVKGFRRILYEIYCLTRVILDKDIITIPVGTAPVSLHEVLFKIETFISCICCILNTVSSFLNFGI